MAGHTPFRVLRDRARANETEADRERRAVTMRAMETARVLGGILDNAEPAALNQLGLVQRDEAAQSLVATVRDEYLATLRDGVEALGGRLEVRAVFPDRTITLLGCERADGD